MQTEMRPLSLKVNGVTYTLEGERGRPLLDVLRKDLGLTGAKQACDCGECGSCMVLIGGRGVMSCLLPVERVGEKEIVTIEGLAGGPGDGTGDPDTLHPLQRAFIELGAAQCGFCIPGMIMQAESLLRRRPHPSRDEIAGALSRNICRCTGYQKIFEAVDGVAEGRWGRVGRIQPRSWSPAAVGAPLTKVDSRDHVTGRSKYADDFPAAGALHLRILRSPHHHAIIRGIDTSAAQQAPRVALVLTHADLPEEAAMLNGRPQPFLLARDRVRFVGEAVAMVAAASEAAAESAATRIKVSYEVLDPVLDPLESFDPSCPQIHPPQANWEEVSRIDSGDVEGAFARAAATVEGVYRTAPREHAPMEPEAGMAWLDGDTVVVQTPQHHPFAAQRWIAGILGVDENRVRIICPAMGGSFGHRGDFVHTALLALTTARTGRTSRVTYTREESLLGSAKAMSYLIRCRTGADPEGKITAFAADIVGDGGCWIPHPEMTRKASAIKSVGMFASGPYHVPAAQVRVVEACTNRPRSNPMRGTNIPDLAFAWESQIDMLAERLGMDRLEIRVRNALKEGDRTITGQLLDEGVGAQRTLSMLRDPYARALRRAREEAPASPWRRGVGVAGVWMVMGGGRYEEAGGGWHGLKLGPAGASAELLDDGRFLVRSGIVEKGQGISIAVQQIAAEVLGVPIDSVRLLFGDTQLAPYPIATSSQRTLFHAGGAMERACRELRTALVAAAAGELGCDSQELSYASGAYSAPGSGARLPLRDLAEILRRRGENPRRVAEFFFEPSERGQGPVYGYSSQLVELDVNERTGEVAVRHVTYVVDAGKVVNPLTLEGQVEGGVMMGLSYALKEAFVPGETRTLKEYGLPSSKDAPGTVETLVIEEPIVGAPFGVKGAAEMTASAGIASVANAIADACGVRCYEAPARPPVLRAVLAGTARPPTFPELPVAAGAESPRT